MRHVLKHYNELTKEELYEILFLRAQVFVVEQNCVFNDLDHHDQQAYHLMMFDELNELVGLSRIIPPGALYTEASIGRIVVGLSYRNKKLGKELVTASIHACETLYPGPIKIMAQHYLNGFYESFGFVGYGDVFMEDGIPHIYMVKS